MSYENHMVNPGYLKETFKPEKKFSPEELAGLEMIARNVRAVLYRSDMPRYGDSAASSGVARERLQVTPESNLSAKTERSGVLQKEGLSFAMRQHILTCLEKINAYGYSLTNGVAAVPDLRVFIPATVQGSFKEVAEQTAPFRFSEEELTAILGSKQFDQLLKEQNSVSIPPELLDVADSPATVQKLLFFLLLSPKQTPLRPFVAERWKKLLTLDPENVVALFLLSLGIPPDGVDLVLGLTPDTAQNAYSIVLDLPKGGQENIESFNGEVALAYTFANVLKFNPYFEFRNGISAGLELPTKVATAQGYEKIITDIYELATKNTEKFDYKTYNHRARDFASVTGARYMSTVASVTGIPVEIDTDRGLLNSACVVWLGKILREKFSFTDRLEKYQLKHQKFVSKKR